MCMDRCLGGWVGGWASGQESFAHHHHHGDYKFLPIGRCVVMRRHKEGRRGQEPVSCQHIMQVKKQMLVTQNSAGRGGPVAQSYSPTFTAVSLFYMHLHEKQARDTPHTHIINSTYTYICVQISHITQLCNNSNTMYSCISRGNNGKKSFRKHTVLNI